VLLVSEARALGQYRLRDVPYFAEPANGLLAIALCFEWNRQTEGLHEVLQFREREFRAEVLDQVGLDSVKAGMFSVVHAVASMRVRHRRSLSEKK
jgi:hypothetical protein